MMIFKVKNLPPSVAACVACMFGYSMVLVQQSDSLRPPAVVAAAAEEKPSANAGRAAKLDLPKLLALIKPQAGESEWMEIPWESSLWEARQKAAAAGKPLYVIIGGVGSAIEFC